MCSVNSNYSWSLEQLYKLRSVWEDEVVPPWSVTPDLQIFSSSLILFFCVICELAQHTVAGAVCLVTSLMCIFFNGKDFHSLLSA